MFIMNGLTVIIVFCVGMFLVCIPFALINDMMTKSNTKNSNKLRKERLAREAAERRASGDPGKGLF